MAIFRMFMGAGGLSGGIGMTHRVRRAAFTRTRTIYPPPTIGNTYHRTPVSLRKSYSAWVCGAFSSETVSCATNCAVQYARFLGDFAEHCSANPVIKGVCDECAAKKRHQTLVFRLPNFAPHSRSNPVRRRCRLCPSWAFPPYDFSARSSWPGFLFARSASAGLDCVGTLGDP